MSSDLEGDLNQDGIIDEMDRVRGTLHGEIDNLGESMRKVFDWQAYVRAAPLTSVGVAATLGFLLAPRIFSRSTPSPMPVSTPGSASATPVNATPTLVSILMAGVARASSAYIADLLAKQFHHGETAHTPPPGTGPTQPPFDVGV